MCISSPFHQEPLDVMSTDDSDAVPSSSTNLSVDTSPNTSYTLAIMKSHESKTDVNDEQAPESNVNVEVVARKGTSQVSLSSLQSSDDIKATLFEVTSVDALSLEGELGEKREHANSAFEIMSVITDDLDSSVNPRNPTSADESLRNISKLESGSEEETTSLSEASRVDSGITTTVEESVSQPIQDTQTIEAIGNGGNSQPGLSRFKRVQMYNRERWLVKDMAPPEEKDPKNPHKLLQENSGVRRELSDTLYSGSTSELGPLSSGSGMLTDAGSEKDGAGSVIDRSSTAAESSLSRKSSLSSIVPDENFETESVASASGSTAGKDRDTPELTHGLTSQGHTTQSLSQLHPILLTHSTASSSIVSSLLTPSMYGVLAPPITVSTSSGLLSTTLVREESSSVAHSPTCSCDSCSDSRERELLAKPVKESQLKRPESVKHAMSHLQSELEQLLKINNDVDKENDDLFEENKQLKDSNQKLKEENQKLKSGEENKQLKDSNHKLREENQKLKSELEKLKKALAIFVNDDSSHLGLKTSPPHGTS